MVSSTFLIRTRFTGFTGNHSEQLVQAAKVGKKKVRKFVNHKPYTLLRYKVVFNQNYSPSTKSNILTPTKVKTKPHAVKTF